MSGVEGIGGAVLAGAASGAISGAVSYTGNYAAQYAYSGFDQNYLDGKEFFGGLGKSVGIGAGTGALLGGLTHKLTTHGTDAGEVIYEPGTESGGTNVGDIRSGAKHIGISGEGHSSHLKMNYEWRGQTRSISWGGDVNNFKDINIGQNAKHFRITGINASRVTERGILIRDYSWLGNNCGQNVVKAATGRSFSFITPTSNYRMLYLRQVFRNYLGI